MVGALVLGGRLHGVAADQSGPPSVRQAESWLGANLARTERLVVDAQVSTDLRHAGWSAASLAPDDSPPDPWASYTYVIATPTLRSNPSALASKALGSASLVATFGDDPDRTDVLRINPGGTAAARAADALQRRLSAAAGRQLVTSSRVLFAPDAEADLLAGAVDPHVLGVLVALGSEHTISVASFANPASEGSEIGLFRQFTLSAIDGVSVAHQPQSMDVAAWFAAQHPPYRPSILGVDGAGLLVALPLSALAMAQ